MIGILWRPPTKDGYRAGRAPDGRWYVERDGEPIGRAATAECAAHVIAEDRRLREFDRAARNAARGGAV